jgi:hypothetical protein
VWRRRLTIKQLYSIYSHATPLSHLLLLFTAQVTRVEISLQINVGDEQQVTAANPLSLLATRSPTYFQTPTEMMRTISSYTMFRSLPIAYARELSTFYTGSNELETEAATVRIVTSMRPLDLQRAPRKCLEFILSPTPWRRRLKAAADGARVDGKPKSLSDAGELFLYIRHVTCH